MKAIALLALLLLAACGADGAPLRPSASASVGVGSGGVGLGAGVATSGVTTSGSFSLGLSL